VTMTSSDVHFDMYDRELYASPYAMYRRLREEAPLYYNDEYRFYLVTRHADVGKVLGDRDTFISGKGFVYQLAVTGAEMPDGLFIAEDPPKHTIHRGLVSRLFTPRAISRIEPKVRELFAASAERVAGEPHFDFMRDFAHMMPIQVIALLLGLPEKDHADLREIFYQAQNEGTADTERDPFAAMLDAAVWFSEYLDFRAEHPTDDLMTELLNVEFEDATGTRRQLRRDELTTFLTLITGAGSDTTAVAVSWMGSILSDHPEQRRKLVEDPTLIPNAVEEVLRFEPPAYHVMRTTTVDVDFHGVTVPADSWIVTLPGAANRDDRVFPDGDTFDVTRKPGQIYTFSFGPHFCLGASLARLEVRIAMEEILKRVPEWTVDHDGAALTTGIDTRGWDRLPVDV